MLGVPFPQSTVQPLSPAFMSLEEQLRSLTMGANSLADGCDTQTKDIKKLRRKSRDLCEELSELHSEIADAAEAASV